MNRSSALLSGIPVRKLFLSTMVPLGLILIAGAVVIPLFILEDGATPPDVEHRTIIRTVFDLQYDSANQSQGLRKIADDHDLERIWVVSATGVIQASNWPNEAGTRLENTWWSHLKDRDSGLFTKRIRYGKTNLILAGLHDAEIGRWVVTLGEPRSSLASSMTSVASGLILSLILLLLTGLILWGGLNRISRASAHLDHQAADVMRGASLSDAAMDRLEAETSPSLAGHAESVVDLIRFGQVEKRKSAEADARFASMFDALPHPAYIRGTERRILAANSALCERLDVSRKDLRGKPVSRVSDLFPVDRIEALLREPRLRHVGFRRMNVPATGRMTMIPVMFRGDDAYIFILEATGATDSGEDVDFNPADTSELPFEAGELERASGGDGSTSLPPAGSVGETNGEQASLSAALELQDIYGATNILVWAVDEKGSTVHWSGAAQRLTGLSKSEIPDLHAFCNKVLVDSDQRDAFDRWTDGTPGACPQHLICRTRTGASVGLTWQAREIKIGKAHDTGREVGILWCSTPVPEGTQST